MKRLAVFAAAALLLAGCGARSPYTGALGPDGSAIPAESGNAPAHARPRAPRAAGPVGVIATNQASRYMDNQESELRERLRTSGVRVARQGDDIVLEMQSDILFSAGSLKLSPPAIRTVDAVAQVLSDYDKTLIEVNGYTDTTGSDRYNMKLSQHRAEMVADVLVDDGINPARISPRGFGETHLRVPTGDNVNEPRNRRVEIRIVPHRGRG